MGDKWTLLIIRDLAAGPRRFVELQRVLPGISTEQLRSRLNRMVADGLLTRKRYREVPPRVDYELTERAAELLPVLGALARWGYDWAWGPPRADEHLDLGAIFRLAPGLLGRGQASGSVELCVSDDRRVEGPVCYSLTMSRAGAKIEPGEAANPDARITGDTEAWIAALAPSADRARLEIEGRRELAEALLDRLGPVAARSARTRAA